MKWLTGKKTYIGAAVLALAAIVGFWYGAIDGVQLTQALGVAFAIVGLGHKADRQIAAAVAALEAAKAARTDAASVSGAAVSTAAGKALEH
jgi:hypothetical protein